MDEVLGNISPYATVSDSSCAANKAAVATTASHPGSPATPPPRLAPRNPQCQSSPAPKPTASSFPNHSSAATSTSSSQSRIRRSHASVLMLSPTLASSRPATTTRTPRRERGMRWRVAEGEEGEEQLCDAEDDDAGAAAAGAEADLGGEAAGPRPAQPSCPLTTGTGINLLSMAEDARERVPILLLKTKSAPTDAYEELFTALDHPRCATVFVPVLEHRFKRDALDVVHHHVVSRGFVPASQHGLATYGALIFTSQRAVEAFADIVEKIRAEGLLAIDHLLPPTLPLYVVGPATARGLRSLKLACPILGEQTGNGEVLAGFILEHYNSMYEGTPKPPILFLVGDKRRDIIPKTLQSKELDLEKRANVVELVIYETGEMQSFKANFTSLCRESAKQGVGRQWIVVFSPTGCQAMLEGLGLLDLATGKAKPTALPRDTFIATIGPTTRDYLVTEFGFTPDVCAERPSPEGIAEGIKAFEEKHD